MGCTNSKNLEINNDLFDHFLFMHTNCYGNNQSIDIMTLENKFLLFIEKYYPTYYNGSFVITLYTIRDMCIARGFKVYPESCVEGWIHTRYIVGLSII